MKNKFWLVFIDHDSKEFEILGQSDDDTAFTENIADMVKKGENVRPGTPGINISENQIRADQTIRGYNEKAGLYRRHLNCL